ncbi:MAG: XRE family transcriptional regulator [Chthoniobacterales bacterium]
MSEIFPQRLHQARVMAKMSLRELSAAMGGLVSYAAISKYEKGEMMPGGEVMAALCAALEQPADFFFRSFRVELDGINFRKRVRLSAGEENSIRERARDFFERYGEIEQLLGAELQYEHLAASEFDVRDLKGAERAAKKLREEWNLGDGPLRNVHELLELHGIKVHEAQTDDEAFDGFSGLAAGKPVVVIARWLNANLPRKRMTEFHELAHIVLRFPPDMPKKEQEKLVNRFAGAFMLPEVPFGKMFGETRGSVSLGELIAMKAFFGASIMAIMKRAEQLGMISHPVYERFCIVASKQHWRSDGEPGNEKYRGNESHGRFRQLVFRAVAEGVISSSRGAAFLQTDLESFRNDFQQLFA